MKYIDFTVQSILFVAALVVVVGNIGGSDAVRVVLWTQLLIGPWQVLSSLISVGIRTRMFKLKVIHLVVSAIYLSVLFIMPFRKFSEVTTLIIFMVPAWALAIYYYILTCGDTFQGSTRQSGFLPHTSF